VVMFAIQNHLPQRAYRIIWVLAATFPVIQRDGSHRSVTPTGELLRTELA